jgi:hypothetical protein
MLTYEAGIDVDYFLTLDDDVLQELCFSNKYLYSICDTIYKIKINSLYPHLPLPKNVKPNYLYYNISKSYDQLMNFAIKYNYKDIIDWIMLPQNHVNYLIEHQIDKTQFVLMGDAVKERRRIKNEIKTLLDLGFIPRQKSINQCLMNGYAFYIELLAQYHFYPTQEVINQATIQGRFDSRLLHYGLIPSHEAVNQGVINGHYYFNLPEYGLIPSQELINQAALNNYDMVIYMLGENYIFPDQDVINMLNDDQSDVLEALAEFGKYPQQ